MLPAVVLTTANEDADVIGSYALGANSYICKLVDLYKFIHAVAQLRLYWLVLNEAPKR